MASVVCRMSASARTRCGVLLIAVFSVSSVHGTSFKPTPVINTDHGPVQGYVGDSANYFLGIPFAQPPVNDLRWSPPADPTPWTETLNATTFQKACYQSSSRSNLSVSEDCLYLNVWTPKTGLTNLPVLLFLHGGGFVQGSASDTLYDGSRIIALERGNYVVVASSYRLGAFGFLGAEQLRSRCKNGCTGNYGLQDQTAALAWVKNNIAAFGGNPDKVMLFGHSAGAASVTAHLFCEDSADKFDAAVIQSGPVAAWGYQPMSAAQSLYGVVAATLRCEDVSCMLAKSAAEIFQASQTGGLGPTSGEQVGASASLIDSLIAWAPVIDGVVLKQDLAQAAANGEFAAKVPLIVGATTAEMTSLIPDGPFTPSLSFTEFLGMLLVLFEDALYALQVALVYPPVRYPTPFWALITVISDAAFVCPSRRTARWSTAAGMATYLYSFAHTPLKPLGPVCLGACHGAEIPFLFYDAEYMDLGKEEGLAHAMIDYWSNFAFSGNPNIGPAGSRQDPTWPRYQNLTDKNMKFTLNSTVESHLAFWHCNFWDLHDNVDSTVDTRSILRNLANLPSPQVLRDTVADNAEALMNALPHLQANTTQVDDVDMLAAIKAALAEVVSNQ